MTIHKNSSRNVHLTYHQTNSPQKKSYQLDNCSNSNISARSQTLLKRLGVGLVHKLTKSLQSVSSRSKDIATYEDKVNNIYTISRSNCGKCYSEQSNRLFCPRLCEHH